MLIPIVQRIGLTYSGIHRTINCGYLHGRKDQKKFHRLPGEVRLKAAFHQGDAANFSMKYNQGAWFDTLVFCVKLVQVVLHACCFHYGVQQR